MGRLDSSIMLVVNEYFVCVRLLSEKAQSAANVPDWRPTLKVTHPGRTAEQLSLNPLLPFLTFVTFFFSICFALEIFGTI